MTDGFRHFECYVGSQNSGKTFAIERRVEAIVASGICSTVFWFDSTGERENSDRRLDGPIVRDWADYVQAVPGGEPLPNEVTFDFWSSDSTLDDVTVLAEAQRQGDVLVVLDEAWEWIGGKEVKEHWKRVILAGRHLHDCDGRLRPMHLLMSTQHPRSISHLVMGQAASVFVAARIRGERTREWVRLEGGREVLAQIDSADVHSWIAVRLPLDEDGAPVDPPETEDLTFITAVCM